MINNIKTLEIQKYIKLSRKRGVISFAAGLPDLSVLPINKIKHAFSDFQNQDISIFQYTAPLRTLKQKIQKMMEELSVSCSLDEILIVNGAQQGINLAASLFFDQQKSLIIEQYTYPGFLQLTQLYNLDCLVIPYHPKHILDLNQIEVYLKQSRTLPFLYIICNGHNPLGTSLPTQKRIDLANLADRYHVTLVEDDPYQYLNYSSKKRLPLRAYTKNALYIGTFSKIVSPALRVGWIVANKNIIEKLEQVKDLNDLSLANPNHIALDSFLGKNAMPSFIQPQIDSYQAKLNHMINQMHAYIKTPFHYIKPSHGIFLWVTFSEVNINDNLDYIFDKAKVLFIPASAFSSNQSSSNSIRLSYSLSTIEQITIGIKRLAKCLHELSTKTKSNHYQHEIETVSS